jgi:hypothetical protein
MIHRRAQELNPFLGSPNIDPFVGQLYIVPKNVCGRAVRFGNSNDS